ncbi:hypothetical protein C7477_10758 [Phyllobacterium leguminum]|uniref:Uncharacterized protein n=1 Tax=Phyllobacterium leguminum TaxID=314237 RepID=A0A318T5N9_9HYPH|nr:hypothetical protein C7477_10758 [Phyllobacterium leguminum]
MGVETVMLNTEPPPPGPMGHPPRKGEGELVHPANSLNRIFTANRSRHAKRFCAGFLSR